MSTGGYQEQQASGAGLGIPLGDAPVPRLPGQPCPPGIGAVKLTVAETARLAKQYAAGHITRAPPRLSPAMVPVAAPPVPRPMAPLQHPPRRRGRHLRPGDRKEVTPCNRRPEPIRSQTATHRSRTAKPRQYY
jgi:hypothetical protein